MTTNTSDGETRKNGRGPFIASASLAVATFLLLEPVGLIFLRFTWPLILVVTVLGAIFGVVATARAGRWHTRTLALVATLIHLAGFAFLAWFLLTDPFSPIPWPWLY